jgi:uncharacterized protein YeaC (DUF1315 family)
MIINNGPPGGIRMDACRWRYVAALAGEGGTVALLKYIAQLSQGTRCNPKRKEGREMYGSRLQGFSKAFFLLMVVGALLAGTAEASQRVRIPYAINGGGWWSGIAITNYGTSDLTPIVYVYDSEGNSQCVTLETIASGQMYVLSMDELLSMLPNKVTDQRLWLAVVSNGTETFAVTLFVGQNNGGFGFQDYESEDVGSALYLCLTLPDF